MCIAMNIIEVKSGTFFQGLAQTAASMHGLTYHIGFASAR